jgi:hypothetical protein
MFSHDLDFQEEDCARCRLLALTLYSEAPKNQNTRAPEKVHVQTALQTILQQEKAI